MSTDVWAMLETLDGALSQLSDPADRYAFLAFLASPSGARVLGRMKDNVVVSHRVLHGGTYADTAAQLRISPAAVNAAVSRSRRADSQDKEGSS